MPKRRRLPRSGIGRLTDDLRADLEWGPRMGLDRSLGYKTPGPIQLRAAWIAHRDELMESFEEGVPDEHWMARRPWGWWKFESGVEEPSGPDFQRDGALALRRLKVLTLDEEAYLEQRHADWAERGIAFPSCPCRQCDVVVAA